MQDWSPIASLRPAYVQLGSEALDGVGSWGVGEGSCSATSRLSILSWTDS